MVLLCLLLVSRIAVLRVCWMRLEAPIAYPSRSLLEIRGSRGKLKSPPYREY